MATAVKRSALLSLVASTRTMFAPGAMACAHSMSRASSISQLPLMFPAPAGSVPAEGPSARLVDLGEAGWIGKAELSIETAEVAVGKAGIRAVHEARVVIRIDDGDRLPAAVARDRAEPDIVDAVSRHDIAGGVADGEGQAVELREDPQRAGLQARGDVARGMVLDQVEVRMDRHHEAGFQVLQQRAERSLASRASVRVRAVTA